MLKADLKYMKRAIRVAEQSRGLCSPNPFVGCVIVKDGRIIAEGRTQAYGGDHAEIQALKIAGNQAQGADMYVSLEPCSHFGKTPPCAAAIITSGIARCYVGILDPNPLVSGKGIHMMKEAGIEVQAGFYTEEISRQLEYHICRVTKNRPFLIWKKALSLDGKFAASDGSSRWISETRSRKFVHKMRSQVDVILTGIGTVQEDDPMLNNRLPKAPRQPVRVILDPYLEMTVESQIAQTASQQRTIIFTAQTPKHPRWALLASRQIEIFTVASTEDRLDLHAVLEKLHSLGFYSVMLECGAKLAAAFFEARLIDKILFFVAPKILGGTRSILADLAINSIDEALDLAQVSCKKIGKDILIEAYTGF